MKHEATFAVTGKVGRWNIPTSGRVAFLVINIDTGVARRDNRGGNVVISHECRCFEPRLIDMVADLVTGQEVTVSGELKRSAIIDRAKKPVKVDERERWEVLLVFDKLMPGTKGRSSPKKEKDEKKDEEQETIDNMEEEGPATPINDDDIPF